MSLRRYSVVVREFTKSHTVKTVPDSRGVWCIAEEARREIARWKEEANRQAAMLAASDYELSKAMQRIDQLQEMLRAGSGRPLAADFFESMTPGGE